MILAIALATAAPAKEVIQSFDAQTPFPPTLADTGGTPQLAYELHLTNFASQAIEVERIAVIDAANRSEVGSATGDLLASWMGAAGKNDGARTVEAGARGVIYLNVPLHGATPKRIAHHIRVRRATDPAGNSHELIVAESAVETRAPVVIGPPLRGGTWAAVYAPEMARGHRRVFYATEGAAKIPGRFAIDWMRVDDSGRRAPVGAKRLDAFFGHGSDVLAVADATVVAVRDDVGEPETIDALPKVSIGDASGNYIALDLGGGRYAFYEHLQRGIRVRLGQKVKRGEVIGKLGLTGSGSTPHLHFHVADTNSLLGAEGLPFRIDRVDVVGGYATIDDFGRGVPWTAASGAKHAGPITPAPNSVVRFPE